MKPVWSGSGWPRRVPQEVDEQSDEWDDEDEDEPEQIPDESEIAGVATGDRQAAEPARATFSHLVGQR